MYSYSYNRSSSLTLNKGLPIAATSFATGTASLNSAISIATLNRYVWIIFFIFWLLFGSYLYQGSLSYATTVQAVYAFEHPAPLGTTPAALVPAQKNSGVSISDKNQTDSSSASPQDKIAAITTPLLRPYLINPSSVAKSNNTPIGPLPAKATSTIPALQPTSVTPPRLAAANLSQAGSTYIQPSLIFEPNLGQLDAQFQFVARGQGYTLLFGPEKTTLTLRGDPTPSSNSSSDPSNTNNTPKSCLNTTAGPDPTENQLTQACFSSSQSNAFYPAASATTKASALAPQKNTATALQISLVGANPQAQLEGQELLPGKSNYFIGNDPTRWRTDIPTYGRLSYKAIYPGIDLSYYTNQGQLEYDFVVAAGFDPDRITLNLAGADQVKLNQAGELVLDLGGKQLRQLAPVFYQEQTTGGRHYLKGSYRLRGLNQVGFVVEENYDRTKPLVIDPLVLAYSTYLGGTGNEMGKAIAVDGSGNAYVTGYTAAPNFPITGTNPIQNNLKGGQDVFVTKLDPNGVRLYSTYLGGTNWDEVGQGIAVTADGYAFVTGYTNSSDFPTTTTSLQPAFGGGAHDAFLAELAPSGSSLIYGTYLGGTGDDLAFGVALDINTNVYLSGYSTGGTNFPTTTTSLQPAFGGGSGATDGFVIKLNPATNTLVYGTFLGGTGEDRAFGVAADRDGNAFVTGVTWGTNNNFPTVPGSYRTSPQGYQDAFVSKLTPNGDRLIYSTYLGGSTGDDSGNGIAVDINGYAYVVGTTTSNDFPHSTTALQPNPAGGQDAFVTKLNFNGSDLAYSTYLGGNQPGAGINEYGNGIAVDKNGRAAVILYAESTNLQTTSGTGLKNNDKSDIYIGQLNANGSALNYATYIGAGTYDNGLGVALDSSGSYVFGTGWTIGGDFPTTAGVSQPSGGGSNNWPNDGYDAVVFKIALPQPTAGVPDAPLLNTATGGSRQIVLGWSAPVTDGGAALSGYKIYRASPTSNNFTAIASVAASSSRVYTDTGLADNTTYRYLVTALNSVGEGTASNVLSATTLSNWVGVPDAPLLNSAGAISIGQILLNWSAPVISNNAVITGYKVYRAAGAVGGSFSLITPNPVALTSFTDSALDNNATYRYYVTALNQVGEGAASNTLTTITNQSDGTTTYQAQITIQDTNAWPNANASQTALIKNVGSGVITLANATVAGTGWVTVSPNPPLAGQVLVPGDQLQVSLAISVPSGTTPTSVPVTLTVNASAANGQNVANSGDFKLNVLNSAVVAVSVGDVANPQGVVPGTIVFIEGNDQPYYDDAGGATLSLESTAGQRLIYTFAPGYLPQADVVTLTTGTNNPPKQVKLTPGNPVQITQVSATPLSYQEAVQRNLTYDPANYDAYQFTVFLNIDTSITISAAALPKQPYEGQEVNLTAGGATDPTRDGTGYTFPVSVPNDGSGNGDGGSNVQGKIKYVKDGGGNLVRQETWIVVPGSARFLKQFFIAKVFVKNGALAADPTSLVLANGVAALSVPDGMVIQKSITNTTNNNTTVTNTWSTSVTQTVPILLAGQGLSLEWLVRGDRTGLYNLSAAITADVKTGGGTTLTTTNVTAKSGIVQVFEPTLDMAYRVDSAYVQQGIPFNLYITATNTSVITLSDLSINLDPDHLQNATISGAISHTLGNLAPRASQGVSFTLIPAVTGCIKLPPESYVQANKDITPHLGIDANGICPGVALTNTNNITNTAFLGNSMGGCPGGQGDMVNPTNGNFVHCMADLGFKPAVNSALSLGVERVYNSLDTEGGLFGRGWSSNFDMRVVLTNTDNTAGAWVVQPDGRRDYYQKNGTDYSPVVTNVYNSLQVTSVGEPSIPLTYTLSTPNQITYTFDFTGTLAQITDRNGNWIKLDYSNLSAGHLTASDNYGRSLNFTVISSTVNTLGYVITDVSDGSHTVHYTYDPAHTYLSTVQDVRGGIIQYNYISDLLDNWLDQNTNKVVKNTYGPDRRVINQTLYVGNTTTYGTSYSYTPGADKTFFVTQYTNPRHYATSYTVFTDTRKLSNVTDALGHTFSQQLDDKLNAAVITLPNHSVVNMAYNPVGLPTSVNRSVTVQGVPQTITSTTGYSPLNDPATLRDGLGQTTSIFYNGAGNPAIVMDALGQKTIVEYDSAGRPITVTAKNGAVTAYNYTGSSYPGLPSSMVQSFQTLVGNNTTPVTVSYRTNFQYTAQGWLSYQSDPFDASGTDGGGMGYEYDQAGHVLTVTNQLGQKASNTYDGAGNLITTINFLGQRTDYHYDGRNRLDQTTQFVSGSGGNIITSFEYDEADNVTKKTLAGTVVTYSYDALNRLSSSQLQLAGGGTVRTDNYYDASGNITQTVRTNNANGGSGNQVINYNYDELNRPTQVDAGLNAVTGYVYDKAGNVTQLSQKVDGATTINTLINYDALNRPLARTIQGVGVGGSLTVSYSYNDAQNLQTVTSAFGAVTTIQNDGLGRPIITTVNPATPANGATSQITYNFYDSKNQLLRTIDPATYWTEYGYDALQRVISTTRYTGTANTGTALTSRTYYTDQAQPQVLTIGPGPQYQRELSVYDEAGRLTAQTTYSGAGSSNPSTIPGGALITGYTYDVRGFLLQVLDPNNHATNYTYENTGWLKTVSETVTGAPDLVTTYSYDLVGNLLKIQDAASRVISYQYDTLNRPTDEFDYLGNHWQTIYDGLGRVKTKIDAKGQQTNYSYDNASRLTTIADQSNLLVTSFTYGNNSSQPTKMVDQIGANFYTTDYGFDGLTRLVAVTNTNGLVQYGYDKLNRRTSLNFGPVGGPTKNVSYGYDGFSRPVSLTNWAGSPQTLNYGYTGSFLSVITYPNGVLASYGFDGAGRLTGITQTKGTTTVFAANYSLDKLGNPITVTENISGFNRSLSYSYDELSRLTKEIQQVKGSGATSPSHFITSTYGYDAAGNRLSLMTLLPPNTKSGTGVLTMTTVYTYNVASQLISRTEQSPDTSFRGSGYNYFYDANGSLTSEVNAAAGGETINYGYDTRNRLISWNKQAKNSTLASASFLYDGADVRLSLTYNNRTTSYLQDSLADNEVVLQEIKSGQRSSFLYPLGSTSPLYQSDANGNGLWYQADNVGSVRALTNDSGVITGTYSYSAFGSNVGETGKTDNTHLFAGEQLDPTGLYYNRARYYNPSLGRFTQRDGMPGNLADPTTLNRYGYANANPLRYIDPSGNEGIDVLGPLKDLVKLGVWLEGAAVSVLNGGDSSKVQQHFEQAVRTNPGEAWAVWEASQWGYKGAIGYVSGLMNMIPIIGQGKAFGELLARQDMFTGRPLEWWELGLNLVGSAFGGANALKEMRAFASEGSAAWRTAESEASRIIEEANSYCSFSEDTPVATEEGEKPIGDLQVGDKVLAYDQESGTTGSYSIQAVLVHDDPEIEYLKIDGEWLQTTPEHPFYTEEQGWVAAGDLWQGAHIRKADGSYGSVETIEVVQQTKKMYNLTVEQAHTFFVGEQRWLVHNMCAQQNEPHETVWRFSTKADPATLRSNLSRASKFTQTRVNFLMRFSIYREWRAHLHMRGYTKNSPFLSVLHDPSGLVNSDDDWATTIAIGDPGLPGVKRAANIGEFSVPSSRLYHPRPTNELSIEETEMVFLGEDLADFLVQWHENPFWPED